MEGRTSNSQKLAVQRVQNYSDEQVHLITTKAHTELIKRLETGKRPYTGGQVEFIGDTGIGTMTVLVTESLPMYSKVKWTPRRFVMTGKWMLGADDVIMWSITRLPTK